MPIEPPKEEKFIVPGWMVSFSDMIVNMMCFFILLVGLANNQECGFKGAGTGEYIDGMQSEGRPGLMPSHRTLIPKNHPLARYHPPQIDPLDKENWIKHTLSTIDEEFERLSHSKSKLQDSGHSFPIPIGVLFAPNSADLTLTDKENLELLVPAVLARKETLEVIGACDQGECTSLREALALSFERARAVVRYLEKRGVPPDRMSAFGAGDNDPASVGDEKGATHRRAALRWLLATS